jgi:hypothetical protein
MSRASVRVWLLGLIAVAACSSEAASVVDGPLAMDAGSVDGVPLDAGGGGDAASSCSAKLETSPASPVAPATIDAKLVVTGCSLAPVAMWFITGPNDQAISPDSDSGLEITFQAPSPGIYTVLVGYMLDSRIVFNQTAQVNVSSG